MKMFILSLVLFFSTVGFVCYRGWQSLALLSPVVKNTYIAIFVLCFLAMLAGFIFSDTLPQKPAIALTTIGYTFLIIVIYMAMAFILIDIIRLTTNVFAEISAESMLRFRIWATGISFVIVCILLAIGKYNFNNLQVAEITINSSLPSQGKQLRIVGLSDVHLGNTIGRNKVQRYVDLINAQSPDLVLIAGDIVDRGIEPVKRQNIHEILLQINSTYGVFGAVGNHEYYSANKALVLNYLEKSGIRMLIDEAILINNSFYIVGRDDITNPDRKPLVKILEPLNRELPVILIDHQPFNLNEAVENNITFQFSGHTHNGQFFPGNLIVRMIYELAYGYMKRGNTHFYVTSGIGIWGPHFRLGTQSEIVVVNFNF